MFISPFQGLRFIYYVGRCPTLYNFSLSGYNSHWILHRHAMQGSMLLYQCTTIHAHYLVMRESCLKHFFSTLVILRLTISRIKHRIIHYQEIGIRCGEAFALFLNLVHHRQCQQTVGVPIQSTEDFQLLFHLMESFVMFILRIGALHIGNSIR